MAHASRFLILLSALHALHTPAVQLSAEHGLSIDLPTRGFLFVGIKGGRTEDKWCDTAKSAVDNLKTVGLPCRNHSTDDASYCQIAFVGDAAATGVVSQRCPTLFDTVKTIDLAHCGLPQKKKDDVRPLKMCVRALAQAPFTYNIQMDFDTLAVGPEIERIFEVLEKGFELTGAFECCALHRPNLAEDTLLHGWEMQTGVLGYQNTSAVAEHARKAVEIYTGKDYPWPLTSVEQNAETQALAQSRVRFMPLPPTFNLREYTTIGFKEMPVAAVHWHYDAKGPVATFRSEVQRYTQSFLQVLKSVSEVMPHFFHVQNNLA